MQTISLDNTLIKKQNKLLMKCLIMLQPKLKLDNHTQNN